MRGGVAVRQPGFGWLPGPLCTWERAGAVVLPVPFERSTTGGSGTAAAPDAIIRASDLIETFDEERGIELSKIGVATLHPPVLEGLSPESALETVRAAVLEILEAGRFPLLLGGEHTLTAGAVAALSDHLGVKPVLVQVDAHSDLRESYLDDRYNHACAMRLCLPYVSALYQVGIRAVSKEEHEFREASGAGGARGGGRRVREAVPIHTFVAGLSRIEAVAAALAAVEGPIYLTVDMDGFDPAAVPGVGTPEPGGLSWSDVMAVVRTVTSHGRLAAADVVELVPIPGQLASEVTAAKLVWRILSCKFFG